MSFALDFISKRYTLHEQLGEGGMGIVFRATNRLTGQIVALKQVTLPTEDLSFGSRTLEPSLHLALAQEFRILSSLRHPNIIAVLDYGFDYTQRPFFTMELLYGSQTILQAAKNKPLDAKIQLLIQLTQALVYLHRRGILHRDIKPSNVMVTGSQVKVLDFGLAIESRQAKGIAGTTMYMAPELIRNEIATPASDLYAVGIIAYELLTDRYPFEVKGLTALLTAHLTTTPDFSFIENSAPSLLPIITRLLEKDPVQRYHYALDLLHDLNSIVDNPSPDNYVAIRESFLQSASFIGREHELNQLKASLQNILNADSQGSCWLIGGESGIGKSRLLDELRTHALVAGILAIRGQSIQEGNTPYHLWYDIIRWLSIEAEPTDFEASVIKGIIPSIGALLNRPVNDAPELEPNAAQDRILQVIEQILNRQTQPVLIILEDIHWADSSSLAILRHLASHSERFPLMIVASYRNDEDFPLFHDFPVVHKLHLKRLSEKEITELSISMLGEEVGQREKVLNLLNRETEGNLFFIVEVVRILADEAGKLELIGKDSLPSNVFSGGMKTMVQHRLNRIPTEYRPLLKLAAVAGRQIEPSLLAEIIPNISLEKWLDICVETSVIDIDDAHYRFAHDKLRESILDSLSLNEEQTLHEKLAAGLEKLTPSQNARLTYHWARAGNSEKELFYATLAANQTLESGAFLETIQLAERSLQLGQELENITPLEQAHLERQIGESYYRLGVFPASITRFHQVLGLLNHPVPKNWPLGILRELTIHLWHRIRLDLLKRPWHKPRYDYEHALTAIRGHARIGIISLFNNERLSFLYCALKSLNISEAAGPAMQDEQARRYGIMVMAASAIPLHKLAKYYLKLAQKAVKGTSNIDIESSLAIIEGVFALGNGQWEVVEERLTYGINLSKKIGYTHTIDDGMLSLAFAYSFQGKFTREEELLQEISDQATAQEKYQIQGTSFRRSSLLIARYGRFDEALALTKEVDAIPSQFKDQSDEAMLNAFIGQIYFYKKDLSSATEYANKAFKLLTEHPPLIYHNLEGFSSIANIYLTLYEREPSTENRNLIHNFMDNFQKYAKRFKIAEPRLAMYTGWLYWIEQKPKKAYKKSLEAIENAQQLNMIYDEAIGHYLLARQLSNHQRQFHITSAISLLEKIGSKADLALVRQLETDYPIGVS